MIKKTTSQAKSAHIAHFQNSKNSINVLLAWNGIWKKFFVWNGIWKKFLGMEWKMEWKKIVGMEYGKIVFHSIPLHALEIEPNHWRRKYTGHFSGPDVIGS